MRRAAHAREQRPEIEGAKRTFRRTALKPLPPSPAVPTSSPIVVLPASLRTSLASIVVRCVHHAVEGDRR
jgi:hypothetical protein